MSYLEKLTEGIRERSLAREGEALLEKWEKTGLLEGLGDDTKRSAMSRLLENQAAQLLKEASSMAAGDVEGFASVAFPIVRRVFGGLLAQDLVSVQPMSLPSGLVFFWTSLSVLTVVVQVIVQPLTKRVNQSTAVVELVRNSLVVLIFRLQTLPVPLTTLRSVVALMIWLTATAPRRVL